MRYNEENKTYERYDKDKKEWVGKTRYNQETQKWENYNPRNGKWEKLLDKDARKTFDTRTSKQKGSKSVHKDHVISAAEQIRDTDAAVHISREERQDFAKKDVNLQDLDSHINQSKGDLSTNDWYNHKRKDGSTQKEHFKMSDEEVNRLKDNDKKARSEYEKEKENGRRKSYEAGKKSQKQEALRITDKAARSAVMILLSDLLRKIVNKLIAWFRLHKKTLDSLLNSLKEVFYEFLGSLKRELLNTGEAVATTIASSIWGSIVNTINKIFIMFKQSWQSLKEAIAYLRNPDNKQKSFEIKMLEVGKIIIAGITASGSIALSEVFEKLLDDIPGFNVQIPLLGSLANILGIFLGALVAGIIGAIAINKIHKTVAKKQNKEAISNSIDQENKVLALQRKAKAVSEEKFYNTKNNKMSNMSERHNVATEIMKNSFSNIMKDITKDPFSKNNQDIIIDEEDVRINKKIDDINSELDDLLSQL